MLVYVETYDIFSHDGMDINYCRRESDKIPQRYHS